MKKETLNDKVAFRIRAVMGRCRAFDGSYANPVVNLMQIWK